MGVAQALTAIVLGLTAPAANAPHTSDSSALQAVAAACAGATTSAGDAHSELEAMYCGVNVVRRAYHLGAVRGNTPLNRSSLIKADAVRRCGFTHTPCGMSFTRTFQRAGYLPARAVAENLAWGQADLGSPVRTLAMWLNSPPHRANLLAQRWRDLGIAVERGHMFGRDGVALWVMQFGRKR
ncbi:MAG TPA: CAP domain-containing protein [Gaiellaceae bacterium]|jgi:uncharacterized protein YkwD|nr:CAP domain-containing protein [Gaiellaceae bacterium]